MTLYWPICCFVIIKLSGNFNTPSAKFWLFTSLGAGPEMPGQEAILRFIGHHALCVSVECELERQNKCFWFLLQHSWVVIQFPMRNHNSTKARQAGRQACKQSCINLCCSCMRCCCGAALTQSCLCSGKLYVLFLFQLKFPSRSAAVPCSEITFHLVLQLFACLPAVYWLVWRSGPLALN